MTKNFEKFVRWIVVNAKTKIQELARTELENKDKKQRLDDYITDIITYNASYWMPANPVLKAIYNYALKKFVLPNVSGFTQLIYDLLKSKIEGVTK